MIQWERNPYVRKHVHRWVIERREPATLGEADYTTPGWPRKPAQPLKLHRRCDDCRARETARVPDESVLIPGYEAIADLDWAVPAVIAPTPVTNGVPLSGGGLGQSGSTAWIIPVIPPFAAPMPIPVPAYPPTPPPAPMYPPFTVGDAVRLIGTTVEGIVVAVDVINATLDWDITMPPYGPTRCHKQAFRQMELV